MAPRCPSAEKRLKPDQTSGTYVNFDQSNSPHSSVPATSWRAFFSKMSGELMPKTSIMDLRIRHLRARTKVVGSALLLVLMLVPFRTTVSDPITIQIVDDHGNPVVGVPAHVRCWTPLWEDEQVMTSDTSGIVTIPARSQDACALVRMGAFIRSFIPHLGRRDTGGDIGLRLPRGYQLDSKASGLRLRFDSGPSGRWSAKTFIAPDPGVEVSISTGVSELEDRTIAIYPNAGGSIATRRLNLVVAQTKRGCR